MTLWTIQPETVYRLIQREGRYVCDPSRVSMPEFLSCYEWLADEMRERIGAPPDGVNYPVWAWHTQNGRRAKPDLRRERWCCGDGGRRMVCLELEVPDERVLLSDFDTWHCVLNDVLITWDEAEDQRLEALYETLSPEEQCVMKRENRRRVFEISPCDSAWIARGQWIQATFWELTADMVTNVRYFTAGDRKCMQKPVEK